jgi:hypothetical protein
MNNKKIPTGIGTAIITIIAVTAGVFVLKCEKQQSEAQLSSANIIKDNAPKNQQQLPSNADGNIENNIKQAFYNKFPDWKNHALTISVETNQEEHAIGKFVYDNGRNDEFSKGEGVWFAAKTSDVWVISEISYVGYNGTCQDFKKYNFPSDMIPDCWDNENNIQIETINPERFYVDGITKESKKEITRAFLSYIKTTSHLAIYVNKDLSLLIIKNTEKYLKGMILINGVENHSMPDFYAAKVGEKWKVVFNGQDYPPCSVIEEYNFPNNIIEKCSDEENKQIKDNLVGQSILEEVSFCGKIYKADRIIINGMDVAKTIAKIGEKENSICKNMELGNFQESGIGIAQKKEESVNNSYLVALFNKNNLKEENDPFNQSPNIFKFNFDNNKIFYQNQFDGSFKPLGIIK